MQNITKKHITYFLLSWISIYSYSQIPFYTFLNGWRGAGVTEVDGNIYTLSNYQEYNNGIGAESWIKLHKIDSLGNVLSEKDVKIDSAKLEGINELGYGAVNFESNNNWVLTGFNVYNTGYFYNHLYRFTSDFDTVNKSLIIPFSLPLGTSQGFGKNLKYVNDSTIIIAGTDRYSNTQYAYSIKVMSIDTLGNINWQTDIYSDQTTAGNFMNSSQITLASDGGYFISCVDATYLPNVGDDNVYYLLIKLDKDGNLQWKKRITDGVHVSNIGAVVEKDSNSYLISWSESWLIEYPNWLLGNHEAQDSASVWVGEIDLQGDFKWKKSLYKTAVNCDTLKASDSYYPYNFIKLSDGNYLICVDHFMNNATYIKLSPDGEVIWNRKIHLLQEQIPGGLLSYTNIKYTKEAEDSGILGVGEYVSDPSLLFPNGIRTSLLIKLDKYGCIEPGCNLEGCTDEEALNYNPNAIYNCGCIYEKCIDSNSVTIDVRQNAIMSNVDFYFKQANNEDTLIKHFGYFPSFYDEFKQSSCASYSCDENYELNIKIRGNVSPNAYIPFQSSDPYSIGYCVF